MRFRSLASLPSWKLSMAEERDHQTTGRPEYTHRPPDAVSPVGSSWRSWRYIRYLSKTVRRTQDTTTEAGMATHLRHGVCVSCTAGAGKGLGGSPVCPSELYRGSVRSTSFTGGVEVMRGTPRPPQGRSLELLCSRGCHLDTRMSESSLRC